LTFGCHLAFGSKHIPIQLFSDEKKEYCWALNAILPYGQWQSEGALVHTQISSKAARSLQNPLFAVNYLDRQLRKDLAEHVRETVRFARRIEQSLERTMIHLVHHNFFKVFRSRCEDPDLTHAERAGVLRERVEALREASLKERAFGWRVELEAWQRDLWKRKIGVPIHPVTPLARHLMTA